MFANARWTDAGGYLLTRAVVQRGLGIIYLSAFVVALRQFRPLLGDHGLLPVHRYVARARFRRSPSLFHWHYSDPLLVAVATIGVISSAAVIVGAVEWLPTWTAMLVWFVLWALYLSIVNVGQTFYAFGWETLLLEAGFLAIFLGASDTAPPAVTLWLFRWLAFRVEFGAGLIKMRGDRCWRDLTCLYYHHETQPLPNPLSWYFHHLPRRMHKVEVFANHIVQLVVPFALFLPQPIAGTAAVVIIVTQCWLVLSGNFSWLNAVTIVIAAAAVPDRFLRSWLPDRHAATSSPTWFTLVVLAAGVVVVVLSYRPARNLVSRDQLMNSSFDALRLVNTYGAFGSITRARNELIIEGTADERLDEATEWRPYEFKAKPGDPTRRPPQVAPYHLRLDWLMWFAAMSPPGRHHWLDSLLERLLEGDRATLRLLRGNPFPDAPPRYVRVSLYRYRFTTRAERRRTGAWWNRTFVAPYTRPRARPMPMGASGT